MEINNTVIIVTGAGSGIGRAIALELARRGGRIVCAGRRADRLEQTVGQIAAAGGEALAISTDVTDSASVQHLMQQTVRHFGHLDVLINNAGSFQTLGAVWEVDPDQWWQDVTINLRGPMLCAHHALSYMIERGSGIVINMRGGDQIPGGTGYSCSKTAVTRLTELLARELEIKDTGVLCFGMGPGFVQTEMTAPQFNTDVGRYWLPSSTRAVQTGKDRPPEDCARAIAALIEHADPALNGQAFGPDTDFAQALDQARAQAAT